MRDSCDVNVLRIAYLGSHRADVGRYRFSDKIWHGIGLDQPVLEFSTSNGGRSLCIGQERRLGGPHPGAKTRGF